MFDVTLNQTKPNQTKQNVVDSKHFQLLETSRQFLRCCFLKFWVTTRWLIFLFIFTIFILISSEIFATILYTSIFIIFKPNSVLLQENICKLSVEKKFKFKTVYLLWFMRFCRKKCTSILAGGQASLTLIQNFFYRIYWLSIELTLIVPIVDL